MDKKNLALTGLIVGCVGALLTIVSLFIGAFLIFIAPICAIVAIICGALGLKNPDGSANGMGIAALIIGIIFLVIDIPLFICTVWACRVASAANYFLY